MEVLLPYVDFETQRLIMHKTINPSQLYDLIFENLPETCFPVLYEHILLISQGELGALCERRPNFRFLQSKHGQKFVSQVETQQFYATEFANSAAFVGCFEYANQQIRFRDTPLTMIQFAFAIQMRQVYTMDELVDLSVLMLQDDQLFLALHALVVEQLKGLAVEDQITIILCLYAPLIMKPLSSNVHIVFLTAGVSASLQDLAFDVLVTYFPQIQPYLPFEIAQILLKALIANDQSGIFPGLLTMTSNKKQIIEELNAKIDEKQRIQQLVSKPKLFKESFNGDFTGFFSENDVAPEAKFDILSRNLDELSAFFDYKISSVVVKEDNALLKVVRQCLADFLLSGEGQAVEKVVNAIALKCAEKLQFDPKSCLFVVCGITMLNTQFDFELQGRRLTRYISSADFIKMMHTSPNFDVQTLDAPFLAGLYAGLKTTPLGLHHCIFEAFTCNFMTFDAEIAGGCPQLQELVRVPHAQKANYATAQYFCRTRERLQGGVPRADNGFALAPLMLEHALAAVGASSNFGQIQALLDAILDAFAGSESSNFVINGVLALLSICGFQNSEILALSDASQIAQMAAAAKLNRKQIQIFASILKILPAVIPHFNDSELDQVLYNLLILDALRLSDFGSSQPFLALQPLLRAGDFAVFAAIFARFRPFLAAKTIEIVDFTNLKYLLFTQIGPKTQRVPASKEVLKVAVLQPFQYATNLAITRILSWFLGEKSAKTSVLLSEICACRDLVWARLQPGQIVKIERAFRVQQQPFLEVFQGMKSQIVLNGAFAVTLKEAYQFLEAQEPVEFSAQEFLQLVLRLRENARYRQIWLPFVPKFFVFSQQKLKDCESAIVEDLVARTDLAGFAFFLEDVQNLSTLILLYKMLTGLELDFLLLKKSIADFVISVKTVGIVQLAENLDSEKVRIAVSELVVLQERLTLNDVLGAVLVRNLAVSNEIDFGVKIGIQEFTIGILCVVLGVELKSQFSWFSQSK
ncbi:Sec7 domain-containing protein [Spironucleus salmonicida]|uniref:Sec7 domain-containing protein n=1 Tax=Spironucleus salmonicida TaxID=348837 RepID=V6LTB4_9EUKA|nr:Sec7 domain-containing protein [Spironucleus salmonicida]|eukprot:EST47820.1 Sec7 domain-containing protein [Spironucleus salmonicida]